MLLPADEESVIRMVGSRVASKLSPEFVAEYQLRLQMVNMEGSSHLGAIGLVGLLREFGYKPEPKPKLQPADLSADSGRKVIYAGRSGEYVREGSDGMAVIRLNGERAAREVPINQLQMLAPIVDGIDDDAFEREPGSPAAQLFDEQDDEDPQEIAALLSKWSDVDPGTTVYCEFEGKTFEAEYIDIEGDSSVAVMIEGKRQVMPDANVHLEPVEA